MMKYNIMFYTDQQWLDRLGCNQNNDALLQKDATSPDI